MTPRIKAAMRWVSDPAATTWFDLGRIPEYSPTMQLSAELLMHPPYPRCTLVGEDADGDNVLLAIFADTGKSLAVSGATRLRRGAMLAVEPFAAIATADGGIALHHAKDLPQARRAVALIAWWLIQMRATGGDAHMAQPVPNCLNRARMAKGKRALSYTWRTVAIAPRSPGAPAAQGGTHASPRQHSRRGHWRHLKSGKQCWVRDCSVGDASQGAVYHDYKLREAP